MYYSNKFASGALNKSEKDDFDNMSLLQEDDFCITPPDCIIYKGKLPWGTGDRFPTDSIMERANIYKTFDALYNNNFNGIYDNVIGINEFLQNPITNRPVQNINANLPDYHNMTTMWLNFLTANAPRVTVKNGEDNTGGLDSIISASNFGEVLRKILRDTLFLHGNCVCRVDRQDGANSRIVLMPTKCWQPLMNEVEPTIIDVNVFFNIFGNKDGDFIEFISYFEDGAIKKELFRYNKASKTIGDFVSEEIGEAYGGLGVSPIVVFSGDTLNNSVFGIPICKYWDSAVSGVMHSYNTLGIMAERLKEIMRCMPASATTTDEKSGCTVSAMHGALSYDGTEGAELVAQAGYKTPTVPFSDALEYYNATSKRLSRDTFIPFAFLDPDSSIARGAYSAKALKTMTWTTEQYAQSMIVMVKDTFRMLVYKLYLSMGIDLSIDSISVVFEPGVRDEETLLNIVAKRSGDAVTMSRKEAIGLLDNVDSFVAENKARELEGLEPKPSADVISETDSGDASVVSSIAPTTVDGELVDNSENVINDDPDKTYIAGGESIG